MVPPILDRCVVLHTLGLLRGFQRLRLDNSRPVLCLAAAGNCDWVVGSPFRVGLFLVPLLRLLGNADLGARVNHSAGRRCGTRRARVKG